MRALAFAIAITAAACGTVPSLDDEPSSTSATSNVALTSDARRLEAGTFDVVEPCACEWVDLGDALRCRYFNEHGSGDLYCKTDDDGNAVAEWTQLGDQWLVWAVVVDSREACVELGEDVACGRDL